MAHNPILEVIRQRSPGEWARIRPRVIIDPDGDEIVRGLRDLAFVAAVSEARILEALRGGCLGVPSLTAGRTPLRGETQTRFAWWCYLEDIVSWRRAYSGKSPICPDPTKPITQGPGDNNWTPVGQQVVR